MSDPITVPPALVRGCNTPHGINVLSDWIEEQTGHQPDFHQSGWSETAFDGYKEFLTNTYDSTGCEYGIDLGDGIGDGYDYSNGYGDGMGIGFHSGYGIEGCNDGY